MTTRSGILALLAICSAGQPADEALVVSSYDRLPAFMHPSTRIMEDVMAMFRQNSLLNEMMLNPDVFFRSFFPPLDFGGELNFVPKVELNDEDCILSVHLDGDVDVNEASITVLTNASEVELRISAVRVRQWKAPRDSDDSTEEPQIAASKRLRGYGEMSSLTTIRKIPAPRQCDVLSDAAKATVDAATNSVLIRFPRAMSTEEIFEEKQMAPSAQLGLPYHLADTNDNEMDLSLLMNQSPRNQKKSWWASLFEQEPKKTVPLVAKEEF